MEVVYFKYIDESKICSCREIRYVTFTYVMLIQKNSFKCSIPFRSSAHKKNVKIIGNNPDFLFFWGGT